MSEPSFNCRISTISTGTPCFARCSARLSENPRSEETRLNSSHVSISCSTCSLHDDLPISRIHCLPFCGEQPVNINLRGVRVRRAIEDRQTAGRGTDVRAFFQLPNIDDLDRHSLLCALFSQTIGEPESDRIAPLAEHVDLLSIIPEQGKALTGDRSNKFHSELRMEKKE